MAHDPHIRSESAYFTAHAAQLHQVVVAAAATPVQWQHWYWVCVAGEIAFIPLVLLMTGRWSPRRAKADEAAHDKLVQAELAAIQAAGGLPGPGA